MYINEHPHCPPLIFFLPAVATSSLASMLGHPHTPNNMQAASELCSDSGERLAGDRSPSPPVGDSPEGPLKTGGILLKTCKNTKQNKTHL
jgi:hypothetical protein